MAQRSVAIALLAAAALASSSGCRAGSGVAKPPELPADRYAKCSIKKSQARPLIVEWPSVDRASLESLARRGVVVARYSGCEMELLTRCRAKGSYKYTPVTLQGERITIGNQDELYAKIPIGAAKLEGELEKSGQLVVDTAIVGTYDAEGAAIARSDLEGDCGEATHVLTSLTVGAFEFYSGAAMDVGGGGSALGVGAGARSRSERKLLSRAGNAETCKSATLGDERPPEGCGSLLRVEATPLAAAVPKPIEAPATAPDESTGVEAPPPTPTEEPSGSPSEPAPETASSSAPVDRGAELGGPPPPRRDVVLEPGVLLGFRGPMAIHFGPIEDGISLHHFASVTGGGMLEFGYRLAPLVSIVANGTLFAGKPSHSSNQCPLGLTCRATLVGIGADAVLNPTESERLWIAAGADLTWMFVRRSGSYEDEGTTHELETKRDYRAIGPHLFVGTDFADSYVPQIQYGFMIGYMLRKTISASGENELDGSDVPLGTGFGFSHSIVIFGRFHFDFGARDRNEPAKS